MYYDKIIVIIQWDLYYFSQCCYKIIYFILLFEAFKKIELYHLINIFLVFYLYVGLIHNYLVTL